ncbi:MAG: hypothetical protein KDD82_11465 [Planctomycetes bacterium]|nr:hypothetical protein [Planctomycetota bacterium]
MPDPAPDAPLDSPQPAELEAQPDPALPAVEDDELPVVARLVIEVRSDGTRTVARGGLEDRTTGQRVSLEAKGGSPLELSAQLAKGLMASPLWLGVQTVGGLRRRLRESVSKRLDQLPFRRSKG